MDIYVVFKILQMKGGGGSGNPTNFAEIIYEQPVVTKYKLNWNFTRHPIRTFPELDLRWIVMAKHFSDCNFAIFENC